MISRTTRSDTMLKSLTYTKYYTIPLLNQSTKPHKKPHYKSNNHHHQIKRHQYIQASSSSPNLTSSSSELEEKQQEEIKSKSKAYPFTEIELKWQNYWSENNTFNIPIKNIDKTKPKYYVLDMFPYPSGSGLHVGHPEGYTATDIIARYKRMQGFNVLHPMGWDAFGLPAEQYALQTNTHPKITTEKNINRFKSQLKALGFSYDWDRELSTTDPSYYKWTQWIFLKLFEQGLAYQAEVPVNWCPELGTVLANEEVIDGKSERGNFPVYRVPMKQWMLKITDYAERLLNDLDDLNWSDSIKDMQRNWIGRSEGAEIEFKIKGNLSLNVFTTRPDTIFGATYLVIAPEHPLIQFIISDALKNDINDYLKASSLKSELERTELQKEKTGVFTGAHAVNPVNGEEIPIWIADYVLGSYGSGAIMAVPAHDTRDYEFAMKFNLEIKHVIIKSKNEITEYPYTENGICVNSCSKEFELDINDMHTFEAIKKVNEWLELKKIGKRKINYKLRDWLFARQRYWGEPIPVIYPKNNKNEAIGINETDLPLELPHVDDFKPSGKPESPLSNISDWVNVKNEETGIIMAKRETSTMPQWAASSFYYLRFIDPNNNEKLIDKELEEYWMPVDLYVGGAEHAVLHLLYARFWHKVLYDMGIVSTKEPFDKLINQGMILGEMEYTVYKDKHGNYVSLEEEDSEAMAIRIDETEVKKEGSEYVLKSDSKIKVTGKSYKMSKSRGNVINPDDIVYAYGADSLRLYEMFMGPLKETKVWNTRSVEGVHRFLTRIYRIFKNEEIQDIKANKEQLRILHITIKKVSEDTEDLRFNTAISAMMEFSNAVNRWEVKPREVLVPFVILLSPYAPHLAEELWQLLGNKNTITYEKWPEYDPKLIQITEFEMPVQVNGKLRGVILVNKGITQEEALKAAQSLEKVSKAMNGKEIRKVIFVKDKIINLILN